tara:strand:- start:52 stop:297 length:246 start_codon:yes stop_codon:yes gene_type:complete
MNNETNFLEQLEQKNDYLYQQLKEEYNKYLKVNRDMNNKYPEAYQQTATFYEWVQSVLPEYDTPCDEPLHNHHDGCPVCDM